ncbi:peptidase S9 [Nocardioides oleivorans]|uniref:Peptidase S9 n=1 Tax=Nocardioides oleivorans TaxID=273676 RepID=A0A4V1RKZ5_9ACTN|nr:prolyl oligopeptidase family serine peptidase [Nocardioides oleivorans]RYB94002.1 peptidase S9 [Nocardioides oleivorans]
MAALTLATRSSLATAAFVLLAGCTSDPDAAPAPAGESTSSTTTAEPEAGEQPNEEPTDEPTATEAPEPPPNPISIAALAQADLTGGGLRLGAVRERTPAYTSYDVTFASTTAGEGTAPLRISGVLNVPTGRVPRGGQGWPAVVLGHGYIDPGSYVRGQGMTRERGFLAQRGYVALHVDYRNHAESTDDPRIESAVRLGYATDVIAAAQARQKSQDVRVDADRIALFGRSMGGGVMLKALAIDPGLFAAGVGWASVSSLEGQNFDHFQRPDAPVAQLEAAFRGRHGLPGEDPEFWRGVSPRPDFADITEPVLMVHGRFDDTCPPPWATATQRALTRAGVDATLEWYDDGHAFGPAFVAAMDRTVRFLDNRMPA